MGSKDTATKKSAMFKPIWTQIANSPKAKLQWIVYAYLAWQLVQSFLWYTSQFTFKQTNLLVYKQPPRTYASFKGILNMYKVIQYCLPQFFVASMIFPFSAILSISNHSGVSKQKKRQKKNNIEETNFMFLKYFSCCYPQLRLMIQENLKTWKISRNVKNRWCFLQNVVNILQYVWLQNNMITVWFIRKTYQEYQPDQPGP